MAIATASPATGTATADAVPDVIAVVVGVVVVAAEKPKLGRPSAVVLAASVPLCTFDTPAASEDEVAESPAACAAARSLPAGALASASAGAFASSSACVCVCCAGASAGAGALVLLADGSDAVLPVLSAFVADGVCSVDTLSVALCAGDGSRSVLTGRAVLARALVDSPIAAPEVEEPAGAGSASSAAVTTIAAATGCDTLGAACAWFTAAAALAFVPLVSSSGALLAPREDVFVGAEGVADCGTPAEEIVDASATSPLFAALASGGGAGLPVLPPAALAVAGATLVALAVAVPLSGAFRPALRSVALAVVLPLAAVIGGVLLPLLDVRFVVLPRTALSLLALRFVVMPCIASAAISLLLIVAFEVALPLGATTVVTFLPPVALGREFVLSGLGGALAAEVAF